MRKPILTMFAAALCAAVIALSGCGSPSGEGPATADAWDYYVDAASGNDASNTGASSASPFKTIAKALGVAVSGQSVKVSPGTYDEANGETFPLMVPAGVSLIGDEANFGNGPTPTMIAGGGPRGGIPFYICVLPGRGSKISGFVISAKIVGNDVACVMMKENDIEVSSCAIRKDPSTTSSVYGMYFLNGNGQSVYANTVSGVTYGMWFFSEGSRKIENNRITGNTIGVCCYYPGSDLGGGAAGSSGGNVIAGNLQCDISIESSGIVISAMNNFWDNNPPTVGTTSSSDIFIQFLATGSSVDFTGAQKFQE